MTPIFGLRSLAEEDAEVNGVAGCLMAITDPGLDEEGGTHYTTSCDYQDYDWLTGGTPAASSSSSGLTTERRTRRRSIPACSFLLRFVGSIHHRALLMPRPASRYSIG